MLLGLFLVFLLLGSKETAGSKRCPSLREPRHGTVACFDGKRRVSCAAGPPVGSVAEFACREFYRPSSGGQSSSECRSDGSWSSAAPRCIPDCGRSGSSTSLIVKGREAPRGAFPWHVAIYYTADGNHEYWCGGSLISETAVVTAAHCVWGISPDELMLAFGKHRREYAADEKYSQKRRAKRIEVPSSYQDVAGNYNGDIAVIFLRERVGIGTLAAPVCVDWDQRLTDRQLAEGSEGAVAGWGLTENGTLADSLRAVRVPVVSDEKCIAAQEPDFKKFVTFTTFCAGHANGTGVCNGDSGGGLAFFDEASARWYLQGLVSVSPRRKGTPRCDPDFYAIFTKVGAFARWLKAVQESEGESSDAEGRLRGFYAVFGGGRSPFPHTSAMLELARKALRGRRGASSPRSPLFPATRGSTVARGNSSSLPPLAEAFREGIRNPSSSKETENKGFF